MVRYKVFYTRTINGEIEVEASSPDEASEMITDGTNGGVDFADGYEYEEPVEVYSVDTV